MAAEVSMLKMAHKINSIGPVNPDGLDDIAEALLNEKEEKPKPEEKEEIKQVVHQPINAIQNLDRYILLEGRDNGDSCIYPDLLVSMDKSYPRMSWYETHAALSREGSYMLTIRQFVDFLNVLKSGKAFDGKGNLLGKIESETLFDEIVARANSGGRSEWLDAKFSRKGLAQRLYITAHNIQSSGISDETTEPLDNCLRWSRKHGKSGLAINFWLDSPTLQGMPRNNAPDGDIYYLRPKNGKVARFSADMDRVIFNCREDPHLLYPGPGVRPVKLK